MDDSGRIYHGDDVPDEDKARLDGYLRGRAEAEILIAQKTDELEAQIRKMEEAQRRVQGDG